MREDIPTPLPAGPATFSATPHWFDFYTADRKTAPRTAPPITTGRTTTAPPKTQKRHSKPANPWYHWVSLICIVQYTSAAEVLLPPFARSTSRIAPTSRRSCSPAPRLPPNCHIAPAPIPPLATDSPSFTVPRSGFAVPEPGFTVPKTVHFSRFFMLLTLVLLPYFSPP